MVNLEISESQEFYLMTFKTIKLLKVGTVFALFRARIVTGTIIHTPQKLLIHKQMKKA